MKPTFWTARYSEIKRLGESHQESARRLVREARRLGLNWTEEQIAMTLNEMLLTDQFDLWSGDGARFCDYWFFEKVND
jgi:hypothetical protein